MQGFETFDLRMWLDGVLTVWNEVHRTIQTTKSHTVVRRSISAAAVAVGLTVGTANAFTMPAGQTGAWSSLELPVTVAKGANAVPPEYWSALVDEMSEWERLPEFEGELPMPI